MIKATLTGAPDDLGIQLLAFAKPRTVEQFERIVEAVGGRDRFEANFSGDAVKTKIGDANLTVYAPRDTQPPRPVRPKNQFIAEFLGTGEGDQS